METEEKSGSDELPSEKEKLLDKQLLQSVMESSAKDQTIRDLRNQLEAKKTDPAILKILENSQKSSEMTNTLLAQLLKQNNEKQQTTTEKVASGVAKTVLPTAGVATAVPLAMRFIPPQQPSMFNVNDAVAKLAAQGVKLAPSVLENATQAVANNTLPQVVDAAENVTGG